MVAEFFGHTYSFEVVPLQKKGGYGYLYVVIFLWFIGLDVQNYAH